MIKFSHEGDFKKTERMIRNSYNLSTRILNILNKYGKDGVEALMAATPVDTGLTSRSWRYTVKQTINGFMIDFFNINMVNDVVIAVIIQYGHGLANGRYVYGIDYINPALRPVFSRMGDAIWKEIRNL